MPRWLSKHGKITCGIVRL
jgi:hypothetical protein